jgi:4'-phosphopantetheinyl transferase
MPLRQRKKACCTGPAYIEGKRPMTSRQPERAAFPQIIDIDDIPALGPEEVHLWLLPLSQPSNMLDALTAALDTEEVARASRFRLAHDQHRFMAARGLLRHVLGSYLGVAGRRLRFEYGAWGKPFILNDDGQPELQFNLSHSCDWALLGVTRKLEIGVDIEAVREIPDAMEIALQNFAPGEIAALRTVETSRRLGAFYACWTRKEAYVKALGGGLELALDCFEMSVEPIDDAAVVVCNEGIYPAGTYEILGFAPLSGFRGAVAVRAVGIPVRRLRLA